MISEFFIVSVGMFTTLDVVADVLTLASDVVFLTVLKIHPTLQVFSAYVLLLACVFQTLFFACLKEKFLSKKFASKRVFIVTVSVQPSFILFFLQP